ncbi:MAG: hypothetical protein Q7V62_14090, partial [Actinomycetota bacterium]|nr:hypothetical protein [Actinomycetota bacterium]
MPGIYTQEVQELKLTGVAGGTFVLTAGAQVTSPITWLADDVAMARDIEFALNATMPAGTALAQVTVTGSGTFSIAYETFGNQPPMSVDVGNLQGLQVRTDDIPWIGDDLLQAQAISDALNGVLGAGAVTSVALAGADTFDVTFAAGTDYNPVVIDATHLNTTVDIDWNATAAEIQTALNALPGALGAVVSGGDAMATTTQNGTAAQQEVQRVTWLGFDYYVDFSYEGYSTWLPFYATAQDVEDALNALPSIAAAVTNEVQQLDMVGTTGTSGTSVFKLSFLGVQTADITWANNDTTLAGRIETALEGIAAIGTGGVTVTVGTVANTFDIKFTDVG